MPGRGRLAATLYLLSILLLPVQGWAGIGMASSEPILVDTQAPQLQVDPLVENLLLQGGDEHTFHWTVTEPNPGLTAADYQARILLVDEVVAQIDWLENPAEYSWVWTVPELQSGGLRLQVVVRDLMGNTSTHLSDRFTVLLSTSGAPQVPAQIQLGHPYPNPFNPSCTLEFSLPAAGRVTVAVFDTRGRRVQQLWQGTAPAGTTRLEWQGTDQSGRPQPAGVYFFVLETPDQPRQVTRAVLIP